MHYFLLNITSKFIQCFAPVQDANGMLQRWANFIGCVFLFFFCLFWILDLNFLITFKKLLLYERLLISKKVTSIISLNVKLWLDVILVVLTVMIELSIVRKKIGYH